MAVGLMDYVLKASELKNAKIVGHVITGSFGLYCIQIQLENGLILNLFASHYSIAIKDMQHHIYTIENCES